MRRRTFPNFIGDVFELEERQLRLELIMRVIGFSPEKPYTLTVNDGTFNRVSIGKINGDYGIKIVDNAGNEIILANGTIVADAIKTGTLDCDLITVTNLDASSITTGYLSATRIQGGTLDCGTMTVSSLNADSITVGTFTNINDRLSAQAIHGEKLQVGTVNADRIVAYSITADKIDTGAIETDKIAVGVGLTSPVIDAGIITGATIKTAATGQRVVLDSNNQVRCYSATGNLVTIYASGNNLYLLGNNLASFSGEIYAASDIRSGANVYGNNIVTGGTLYGSHLYLGYGASEGNIYNIDQLRGYNDIRSYVSGGERAIWYSTSGGGDLTFYPYWGDFYASGTKYFRIPHPDNPDKQWLQYVSVEAPEVALKIRGKAVLNNGKAIIKTPHHWELATEEYLTTVQITPLGDCKGLFAKNVKNISFEVKELQGGTSNVGFMWELTATRKGYSDFNPEQTVEKEAEKVADSLVYSSSETKKEYFEREEKRKDERIGFRLLVAKKYKLKTGKKYVDNVKMWHNEDYDKELAKEIKLKDERAKLMSEIGEV